MQSMGTGDHSINFHGNFDTSPIKDGSGEVKGITLKTGDTVVGYAVGSYSSLGLTARQDILNKLESGRPVLIIDLDDLPQTQGGTGARVDGSGDAGKVLKANVWFSPNMMVSLSINLTEMAMQMKDSRITELGATLQAMDMVWEFSQNTHDMILAAGQAESQMKLMEGAAGLMTAAGGVAVGGMAGHASSKGASDGFKTFMTSSGGGQALSQVVGGTSQAISGFVNSGLVMVKANAEAEKEVSETQKQLQNQILQSSGDARKELEDLLTKALDMLKAAWEQNQRANQNFMPRN